MWRDIMKKEEMKFLDEIAAIGFAKKMREDQDEADRRRRLDDASRSDGE